MPTRKRTTAPRKHRGDALLDKKLTREQARAFFEKLERGTTLTEGQEYLHKTHKVKISRAAICQWAKRRRRDFSDIAFNQLIGKIRNDNQQATELGQQIGAAHRLNDANVLMLSQALFESRRSEDPRAMKQAADLFSTVLAAVAKSRQADADVLRAETSRNKFQYDAAKAALKHAAELREISKRRSASEQEKVERAIARLFGERPVSEAEEKSKIENPQDEEEGEKCGNGSESSNSVILSGV